MNKNMNGKRLVLILLCAALIFVFSGCVYIVSGEKVSGNGRNSTKEVQLQKTLTGIVNRGSFDVLIDPSVEGKAILEGESNIIDRVIVEQKGDGVLEISFPPNTTIINHSGITVRVPMLQGGLVQLDGSGTVQYKGDAPITTGSFDFQINGSGDVMLNLKGDKLRTVISGSGSVDLIGQVTDEDITINGSGNFDGFELAALNVNIEIRGSGDINVATQKTLTGSIFGSGDVTYEGNPERVDVSKTGSGDVNKR